MINERNTITRPVDLEVVDRSPINQNPAVVKETQDAVLPMLPVCIDRSVRDSVTKGVGQSVVDFSTKQKIISNYRR